MCERSFCTVFVLPALIGLLEGEGNRKHKHRCDNIGEHHAGQDHDAFFVVMLGDPRPELKTLEVLEHLEKYHAEHNRSSESVNTENSFFRLLDRISRSLCGYGRC